MYQCHIIYYRPKDINEFLEIQIPLTISFADYPLPAMPLSSLSPWILWMFHKVCLKHHDTSLNDIHIWQQAFLNQKGNENASFIEKCLHFSVLPNTWENPRFSFFVKKNLKERIYANTSLHLNPYHFIRCSTTNTRKKATLTKKGTLNMLLEDTGKY